MIKVYSKPNCMQCKFTKEYLDNNNKKYESIDVLEDEQAFEYIKSLGFQSLPVVECEDDTFSGFRPDLLAKL